MYPKGNAKLEGPFDIFQKSITFPSVQPLLNAKALESFKKTTFCKEESTLIQVTQGGQAVMLLHKWVQMSPDWRSLP